MRYVSFVLLLLLTPALQAENWSNWRGPTLNGVASGDKYPTKWSATENVEWKIEMPGFGSSTPIVWEDNIFVTCGDGEMNALICYDRSGKLKWKKNVGKQRKGKHKKATGSNSSPVTDGNHVFAYFKSGDFACFDMNGKQVWAKNLQDLYGKDTLWWDLGTSPILTSKYVVVACMHSGPSYVAAFNKKNGSAVWKTDRNMEAPVEANQSYTTPIVVGEGESEQIVTLGADHVTSHLSISGREVWRVGGLNPEKNGYFRSISSPVVVGDYVIAPYARGNTLTAIKLGGEGDVTKSNVVWTQKIGADVPTPARIDDNHVLVCTDRATLASVKLDSGEIVWEKRVKKRAPHISASPIVAGKNAYLIAENGVTFVVEIGGEVLAENSLDEFAVASPVLVDGKILLRTEKSLYCISQK